MRMQDMTEPQLAVLMTKCAQAIKVVLVLAGLDDPPLFVLLVFNDPAATQYISSCTREDIIKAMRAAADRLETHGDVMRRLPDTDPRLN